MQQCNTAAVAWNRIWDAVCMRVRDAVNCRCFLCVSVPYLMHKNDQKISIYNFIMLHPAAVAPGSCATPSPAAADDINIIPFTTLLSVQIVEW